MLSIISIYLIVGTLICFFYEWWIFNFDKFVPLLEKEIERKSHFKSAEYIDQEKESLTICKKLVDITKAAKIEWQLIIVVFVIALWPWFVFDMFRPRFLVKK